MKLAEKSKEWLRIFQHHCPDKNDIPKTRLTTQKANILKTKSFSEEELKYMNNEIKNMNDNRVCPIENPIPTPNLETEQPVLPPTPEEDAVNLNPTDPLASAISTTDTALRTSPRPTPHPPSVSPTNTTQTSPINPPLLPCKQTSPRASPET